MAASRRRRNHSLSPDFRRTLAAVPFALRNARRAQKNSVANIANPAAMIGKPGPGNTIMMNPRSKTVPPIRPIKNFFTRLYWFYDTTQPSRTPDHLRRANDLICSIMASPPRARPAPCQSGRRPCPKLRSANHLSRPARRLRTRLFADAN